MDGHGSREEESDAALTRSGERRKTPRGMKLDRLLARHQGMGRKEARRRIAAGRVTVGDAVATRNELEVDRFTKVALDGQELRPAGRLLHLLLHKPVGVVSATSDSEHRTVIDLIDDPDRDQLHLAGRLDRFTSGLVLLTNDGRWSKRLMDPARKVAKVYRVETAETIEPSAIEAFARGFHFPTEDLVTRPALLELLGDKEARLTLHEGRYHQIKRMFHRVANRVTALHRESIGPYRLPADLAPGEWRALSPAEAAWAFADERDDRESSPCQAPEHDR